MPRVAALWRHPIKSHGREALDQVTLTEGQTMPWDRVWAVMHEQSKFDAETPAWVSCRNFMIGASTPGLAGIWAQFDAVTGIMHLRHDALGQISFDPDNSDDAARFVAWVRPVCPPEKLQPTRLAKAPDRGMTDSNYPTVSIMTQASHNAVSQKLGRPLEIERWRGNIWLDGAGPWEELEWLGKDVQIGAAILHVVEPIERCKHTMANPRTGTRDADTLAALRDGWNHQDFGVYAKVIKGGKVALNDTAKVV
ncbi:MOSC domain-containing protein [Roseobacter sp. CCS2]|uniref:MOSC domain-containing protein n=1 Tax=Roseobacter sp. CCS2 TaxID=391593 RepID=UPI0000F3E3A5|nr:MOSC domain-containing protein [Roseobacter sp. CCS2]EBA11950.1 MOSC domain protein [Roseobacter sp. CCS2]